jgi:CheY-like chemotaxis protein
MTSTGNALNGIRILCVDDCSEVLGFLRVFLLSRGAIVTTSTSAEDAITLLRANRFDVLISDLQMPPGLDGYDLAHALREMEAENLGRPATPAILLSGNAMLPSRKRRFADFQVYMPKPFDKGRIVHIVERLAEADSEAVKLGSLAGWEAQKAVEAAVVATSVAGVATAAAAEATADAANSTTAAVDATVSAGRAKATASKAETDALAASASAPPELRL